MPRLLPLLLLFLPALPAAALPPGAPIDYSKLAFYPDRWEERGHKLELTPWEGRHIAFLTNADGLTEKQNRLKTSPTDQPVMYASAMLKLHKELGNDWLKAFFRQLATCPDANPKTKEGAQQQCFHWFLAASVAAKKDLSPTFVAKWRLQLTNAQTTALKAVDWTAADLRAATIAKSLAP